MSTRPAPRPQLARGRLPVLALGGICLLLGLTGGLARLGAGTPSPQSAAAGHGVLMTLGFLGTLISLERAVALRHAWGYLAPVLSGLGGIAYVAGAPAPGPALLFAAAGAWLIGAYLVMWQVQPALHIAIQMLGAIAWWAAALLWLIGRGLPAIVPWLAAYVILTISGERLELARVALRGTRHLPGLVIWSVLIMAGPAVSVLRPVAGGRVFGVGLLVLAAWLVRYDVARRTVRTSGLTRYMAVCLLTGYVWLTLAGVLWVVEGQIASGPGYDGAVHAVFFGYAMSMVLGHAPVILPAVLRVRLPHHPRDYAVLALLHVSFALRILGGDLAGVDALRVLGGSLGVVTLLAFVANAISSIIGAQRAADVRPAPAAPRAAAARAAAPGSPSPAASGTPSEDR
ncbi:MAG TPA: hypothetical protein VFL94_02845 [Actinomycetales bacterium]|nr:hypothetical protein [Actinomycetales bacterium]